MSGRDTLWEYEDGLFVLLVKSTQELKEFKLRSSTVVDFELKLM